MSTEYSTTRWWENYLVRYLMPSIAGMVIISWLCSQAGDGFRAILLLPGRIGPIPAVTPLVPRLDTTSLTLLFLYGNLFCYIASYPILVFHATRVIDFPNARWSPKLVDGYLATLLFAVSAFSVFHLPSGNLRYYLAFGLASLMALVQLVRLYMASSRRIQNLPGLSEGWVSQSYGFAFTLAKRRGVVETKTTIGSAAAENSTTEDNQDDEDEVRNHRQIAWRQELISTYRHMREHGNSAFIFLLEVGLAALVYCVITKPGQSATQQLGATGAVLAIWAAPSLFVHLFAQNFERRVSKFDDKHRRSTSQANASRVDWLSIVRVFRSR